MKIHKDLRPLVKELRSNGCELEPAGRHYAVMKDGRRLCMFPGTPGDVRTFKNTRATLRQFGAIS